MLRTAIMEGFECKQLWENSKHVVKKIAMSFQVRSSCRKRYCEKPKLIDDIDLYAIEDENFTYDINCFPAITYSYLDFGTSPFSAEDMKAYKRLIHIIKFWKGGLSILKRSLLNLA